MPRIDVGHVLEEAPHNQVMGRDVLSLSPSLLARHTYLLGSTGGGKTQVCKGLAYQLTLTGQPYACIDGVGGLIDESLLAAFGAMSRSMAMQEHTPFAALNRSRRLARRALFRRVIYLNLRDPKANGYSFNPLKRVPWLTAAQQVDLFIESIAPLVGRLEEQRRMLNVLRCTLTTLIQLAELDGVGPATLRDVFDFLVAEPRDVEFFLNALARRNFRFRPRRTLVEAYLRDFFIVCGPRDKQELVASTLNLLNFVFLDEAASTFLAGSPESNMDFSEIVNEGRILLVLLPDGLHTKRLLGGLIFTYLEAAAKKRTPKQVKSGAVPRFTIIADEFHQYVNPTWGDSVSTARNRGIQLVMAHQSSGQMITDEQKELLKTIKANTAVKFFFRIGRDDAKEVAASIFLPMGKLVNRVERSITDTESRGATTTQTVGVQTTESESLTEGNSWTVAIGENQSVAIGEALGRTWAENESMSVTWSKGQSRAVCKNTGYAVSLSESSSASEGVADGAAQSTGQSHSTGMSSATFQSSGQSIDLLAVGLPGTPQKANTGSGSSSAASSSTAESLSRAISRVVTAAKALSSSRAVSRSKGESVTKGQTTGQAESLGRAVSRGLSEVQSLVESLGSSLTRSTARQESRGFSRGQGHSLGQSLGESVGVSQSVSDRTVYYSIQEEIEVRANQLSSLKSRTAWVVLNEDDGTDAVLVRTLEMPQVWETKLGGKCYLKEFLELSRGTMVPPPSNLDLVPRVQSEVKRGK